MIDHNAVPDFCGLNTRPLIKRTTGALVSSLLLVSQCLLLIQAALSVVSSSQPLLFQATLSVVSSNTVCCSKQHCFKQTCVLFQANLFGVSSNTTCCFKHTFVLFQATLLGVPSKPACCFKQTCMLFQADCLFYKVICCSLFIIWFTFYNLV